MDYQLRVCSLLGLDGFQIVRIYAKEAQLAFLALSTVRPRHAVVKQWASMSHALHHRVEEACVAQVPHSICDPLHGRFINNHFIGRPLRYLLYSADTLELGGFRSLFLRIRLRFWCLHRMILVILMLISLVLGEERHELLMMHDLVVLIWLAHLHIK